MDLISTNGKNEDHVELKSIEATFLAPFLINFKNISIYISACVYRRFFFRVL